MKDAGILNRSPLSLVQEIDGRGFDVKLRDTQTQFMDRCQALYLECMGLTLR